MVNKILGIPNRGQLKIQQMIFMLIGIVVFFALIALLVTAGIMNNLKESSRNLAQEQAIRSALRIANTPEFSCGEIYGASSLASCIDFDKVFYLKEFSEKYRVLWEVNGIEIRRIYPKGENIECTTLNYPECDVLRILETRQGGTGYPGFVSLCRSAIVDGKSVRKCELAQIIIIN